MSWLAANSSILRYTYTVIKTLMPLQYPLSNQSKDKFPLVYRYVYCFQLPVADRQYDSPSGTLRREVESAWRRGLARPGGAGHEIRVIRRVVAIQIITSRRRKRIKSYWRSNNLSNERKNAGAHARGGPQIHLPKADDVQSPCKGTF